MNEQRSLMFIGAHPDDESFGMGATLAHYSTAGVKVYFLCSTRGEAGTIDPEFLKGYTGPGDLRWAELSCAARVLGLAEIVHLGYRDSGMPGTPDNHDSQALINAPIDEVVQRMVKVIRNLKPGVIITHDPGGGYGHPDHVATHQAAVKAFYASGDAEQFPQVGPAFQPQKLYFGVRSTRLMRIMLKLMPLVGQNPRRFGRNKDIDLTRVVKVSYPVHAAVAISKKDIETQIKAAACHVSQGGGVPPQRGWFRLMNILGGIQGFFFGRKDYFMRAYPPVNSKRLESDLFEGV